MFTEIITLAMSVPFFLFRAPAFESDAGLPVVQELDPGLFQRPLHQRQRAGARSDFALERL